MNEPQGSEPQAIEGAARARGRSSAAGSGVSVADEWADAYETYRKLLFSIAYRMLGTVAEAEDIVHDVFLSLHSVDLAGIVNMKAFLGKAVTNRCLNALRAGARKKAAYLGPWLPEPLYASGEDGPERRIELEEHIGYAYMVMLERLTPQERVVFVLREAYGCEYGEIAGMLGKSIDNCRKIASRAQRKLNDAGYAADKPADERKQAVVQQFVAALRGGNIAAAIRLLADQAVMVTDGGGKVRSAMRPIAGIERVGAFLQGIAAKGFFSLGVSPIIVGGETGMALVRAGLPQAVWCFELEPSSGKIAAIYAVHNPDKLGGG